MPSTSKTTAWRGGNDDGVGDLAGSRGAKPRGLGDVMFFGNMRIRVEVD